MSVHIIIDGYNLIRQSKHFAQLDRREMQLGREALLDTLAAYKLKSAHRITVVFDGDRTPGLIPDRDRVAGINIRFSHRGQTADTVIKKMAADKKDRVLVVSSDQDIVRFAAAKGAAVISSSEFEDKIAQTLYGDMMDHENDDDAGWTPSTKKKGPRRRPSKKVRRNQKRLNRL